MQQVRIDFDNPGLPQSLGAVEGESQSRIFQAALYKSGAAYTAPAGAVYSIMYRGFGPQNQGWYDTIEDGAGKRAACTVSGNVVTCELARQALRVPGHLTVVLCVTDAKGYMLKNWPIMADVRNDGYEDTGESEMYFNLSGIAGNYLTQLEKAMADAETTRNNLISTSAQAKKDIDAKAAAALKSIPESYTELDGSVKQLNEDLSVYKSTLKASDIKWVTATCYKGKVSFDHTIITSDFFKLEKGSIIKINNENLKSRLTTYTSEKNYLKDSGNYVHVDSYEIKDNGNFYRLSIGNTSDDYSANDSWVDFISFENAQSFNEFVLENEYKSALYNKDEPFSDIEWVSGSIYQGVLDENQTVNISSSVFKAIEGTLIIIPDNWSVRLTFYNDDKSFKVSYGYMKYKQYIVPYDCYMALSLYDGSSPMNTEKGREVKIYYGYKSKISSLEEKTTSLEEKILGYTGTRISLVENGIFFSKKVDYSGNKWGENAWAGGLAVYKNLAFIGYNLGYVAAYDIKSDKLVATGNFSTVGTNHANNLSFDYGNIVNDYPVMYITRASSGYSECYVESVNIEKDTITTSLIQTITYSGSNLDSAYSVNWCLDKSRNKIVAIIYQDFSTVKFLVFEKPSTAEKIVALSDNDIENTFTTKDVSALQASDIFDGKLFVTDGYSNGFLKVFSLSDGTLINSISLSPISTYEPEGLCIYNNKLYINFHQKNDIECILYELKFIN